jgi:hypothetical protein
MSTPHTILVHDTTEPTKRAYNAQGLYESREAAVEALPALVRDMLHDSEDKAETPELLDAWAQEALDHGYVEDHDMGFHIIEINTEG